MAVLEVIIAVPETFAKDGTDGRYLALSQGRDGLMGFAVHDGDLANAPFEFLVNASDVAKAWRLLRENTE